MSAAVHQPAEADRMSRTSSVQRMLELERKMKIEQMQAYGYIDWPRASRASSLTAQTTIRPSSADWRTSSLYSQQGPDAHAKWSRKLVPGLQINVPPMSSPGNITVTSDQHRLNGPEAERTVTSLAPSHDYEMESEATSSICQSPTWENYGRRKKERRTQESASRTHGNNKLTKPPPPPPSASRTPFLSDRKIVLPLLPGHHKRGRGASKDENGSPKQREKESKPKHKRERSESLTRRIRASFEARRNQSTENVAREQRFIGGLKLQRERERGRGRGPKQEEEAHRSSAQPNGTHSVGTSPIASLSMPVGDRPSSGSGHAVGPDGCSPSSVPGDYARPTSPHPLRHKAALLDPNNSLLSSICGNVVSPTAPSFSTLLADAQEKDHETQSAINGTMDAELANHQTCHNGEEDDHGARKFAVSRPRQKLHSSINGTAPSKGRLDGHEHEHENEWLPQHNRQPSYPPSIPYSTTVPAGAAPISPRRRRASVSLGWSHSGATTASVSSTAAIAADEARSPRGSSRQENRKHERSSSAIRSFRDAALSAFHRRPASHARSQSRDAGAERLPLDASSKEPRQHVIEAANGCYFNQPAKRDAPAIVNDFDPETIRPPPPIRSTDRPSDGSSISSYEASISQPSSATTPNTSRPQSEKGLRVIIASAEAKKMLSTGDDTTPSPRSLQGLEFPETPTPPLGPKSPKRASRAIHVPNDTDPGFRTKLDEAEDHLNFSRASLIPQPLTVSTRTSCMVEGLPPPTYLEPSGRTTPSHPNWRARGRSAAGMDSVLSLGASIGLQPITKMFVECCRCKFYLDMPSRVYECMVQPEGTVEDPDLGVHGVVTRFVKCPWCSHAMTTRCCAGYAAVVYLKEKLH